MIDDAMDISSLPAVPSQWTRWPTRRRWCPCSGSACREQMLVHIPSLRYVYACNEGKRKTSVSDYHVCYLHKTGTSVHVH